MEKNLPDLLTLKKTPRKTVVTTFYTGPSAVSHIVISTTETFSIRQNLVHRQIKAPIFIYWFIHAVNA